MIDDEKLMLIWVKMTEVANRGKQNRRGGSMILKLKY